MAINSYDSSNGQIYTKLPNDRELLVLVVPITQTSCKIRITPTNGVYDIDEDQISEIFKNIKD